MHLRAHLADFRAFRCLEHRMTIARNVRKLLERGSNPTLSDRSRAIVVFTNILQAGSKMPVRYDTLRPHST